jgi:hypothetical protein
MPVCWCRWWRCLGKWLVWCCQSDETANTKLRTKRRAPQKTVTASTTRHVCSSCSSADHWQLGTPTSWPAPDRSPPRCPKNVTRQGLQVKCPRHDETSEAFDCRTPERVDDNTPSGLSASRARCDGVCCGGEAFALCPTCPTPLPSMHGRTCFCFPHITPPSETSERVCVCVCVSVCVRACACGLVTQSVQTDRNR